MDEHKDQPGATNAGNGNGHGPKPKEYKFSVDSRPFETEHSQLTGLQLKALASVDVTFGIFLEAHGNDSDRQIADGEVVDLAKPGNERFYTTPAATYGMPHGAVGLVSRASFR